MIGKYVIVKESNENEYLTGMNNNKPEWGGYEKAIKFLSRYEGKQLFIKVSQIEKCNLIQKNTA
jgi:hypothetical protein